jgi:hypothetical protein
VFGSVLPQNEVIGSVLHKFVLPQNEMFNNVTVNCQLSNRVKNTVNFLLNIADKSMGFFYLNCNTWCRKISLDNSNFVGISSAHFEDVYVSMR